MNQNDPLSELNSRLTIIRDRIRGVALRSHTGFYLFGRPGTSKTYTVKTTLDQLNVNYEYFDGHLSAIGLFELLEEHPDSTIILDDVSQLFKNKVALQILLAALGNQPDDRGTRIIKYRRQGRDETVRFTGGIIAISNLELHSDALLEALKSRVHYLQYAPTDEQMAAMMFEIAKNGWRVNDHKMTARECMEVARFLVSESQRRNVRLDMRLLVDKSFPDYLQHREGNSVAHWKDLIISTLEEQTVPLIHTQAESGSRKDTMQIEHEIIRQIIAKVPDRIKRVEAWTEQTGKSERAFYRRLKEMGL